MSANLQKLGSTGSLSIPCDLSQSSELADRPQQAEFPDYEIFKVTEDTPSGNLARKAYRYWLEKTAGQSRPPDWSAFDPLHVPELVPNMIVLTVTRQGQRLEFVYHMIGSLIARVYGEITGLDIATLDREPELTDTTVARARRHLTEVTRAKVPTMSHGTFEHPQLSISRSQTTCLPFSEHDSDVAHIVAIMEFT